VLNLRSSLHADADSPRLEQTVQSLPPDLAMSDALMSSDPSLLEIPTQGSEDEVDSLPESEPDSDDMTISDSDYDDSDADRQWKESLEQLELLLSMVVVPYTGKYFGRKFAFWGPPTNFNMLSGPSLTRFRMETIHGMDVSGRHRDYEQGRIQRLWGRRSRFLVMSILADKDYKIDNDSGLGTVKVLRTVGSSRKISEVP
jgi:Mitochondrial import 2